MITLANLGVTLRERLFSNLDLHIQPGDRIGLAAANGAGKSTLLRCLAGALEPTEGTVTRGRGVHVALVAQDAPAAWSPLTMRAAVQGDRPADEAWRADLALDELEAPEDLRERPLSALSGGWRRLALLARAWTEDPDILLLDEPTNHLDLGKILKLEAWIAALPRNVAVVAASHDRAFLDAVTTRTLFLRPDRSATFALPYTPAREALAEADAAQARGFERDMKEARKLRQQAAKLRNIGVNSGSDLLSLKSKQLKARAQRLEEDARPAHRARSAGAVRLDHGESHARALLTLEDATVTTPAGEALFRTGKLFVRQGDRIAILGANGTGKSRFVAMVKAAVEGRPAAGLKAAASIVLGYGDQGLAELDDRETPMAAIAGRFDVGDQRARSLLSGAGVAMLAQDKPLGALSGGQKARLALLILRLTRPNLHLLDEPTNHLDIEGQEALEAELLKDEATCLVVSHDRSFVRAVANRVWVIERKRLVEADDAEAFFAAAGG